MTRLTYDQIRPRLVRREAFVYPSHVRAMFAWEQHREKPWANLIYAAKTNMVLVDEHFVQKSYHSVASAESFRGHIYDKIHFIDCYSEEMAWSEGKR